MRLRTLSAVGVMVLIAAGLTGCRTNVGVAATIDGQRVTESQVSDYVTPQAHAAPVSTNGVAQAAIPARSFVVEVLIDVSLFTRVFELGAHRTPTTGELSRAETAALQGATMHAATTKAGFTGFTAAFESKLLEVQGLVQLLQQQSASGVPVSANLSNLSKSGFAVSVNPRYGVWDAATSSLTYSAAAGIPDFLTLQSRAATSSSGG